MADEELVPGEHAVEAVLALLPEFGFSREGLMALMCFSVDLGPQRMRELIRTSPSAHLLLPLATALERALGMSPEWRARSMKLLKTSSGRWQP